MILPVWYPYMQSRRIQEGTQQIKETILSRNKLFLESVFYICVLIPFIIQGLAYGVCLYQNIAIWYKIYKWVANWAILVILWKASMVLRKRNIISERNCAILLGVTILWPAVTFYLIPVSFLPSLPNYYAVAQKLQ